MLFDNEQISKKPLRIFLDKFNLESEKIKFLNENLYLKLREDANIFIIITPLKVGEKESEIEDLFTEETLNHKENGKSFSKKDQFNKEKYYGKNNFSEYVRKNYKYIDFDGFKPLLDVIDKVVKLYE